VPEKLARKSSLEDIVKMGCTKFGIKEIGRSVWTVFMRLMRETIDGLL
jgi:hypothetical protein